MKLTKVYIAYICIATTCSPLQALKFTSPSKYNFQGLFAVHSDLKNFYYAILTKQGTQLPGIAIDPNKLIRLQTLIDTQWKDVGLNNDGDTLILAPQISTHGFSPDQKKDILSILSYAIIDRKGDVISVYVYIPHKGGIGNKLTFNITRFEHYMSNTLWDKIERNVDLGFVEFMSNFLAWEFGFEFYTNDADFVPSKKSDDYKKPTLFSTSKYASPMFTIDFHSKLNKYPSGNWAPAAWLAANKLDGGGSKLIFDQKMLNLNYLTDNNIIAKRAFVDADYTYVENVLTNAGIKLPKNE